METRKVSQGKEDKQHHNPVKLMSLAIKPVASPPFPLERVEEMTKLMGGDGAVRW